MLAAAATRSVLLGHQKVMAGAARAKATVPRTRAVCQRPGRMAYYKLADSHVRMLIDVALTHVGHTTAIHPEHP